MSVLTINWQGNGIARLSVATKKLSGNEKTTVLRRALNHTGDRVYTIVVRKLADQIGAPQSVIKRYGKLRRYRAANGLLVYTIKATGGPIPLKHFKAYQTRKGVSAAPWKNRKLYKSAFIVKSLGGHAFWREGRSRLPIKRIAGPNVPKELVKDEVALAFETVVSTRLPARVAHELKVLTDGVLS